MIGHWISTPFNPDEYFGFLYIITCIPTGKMYIGKKNFRSKNGKNNNWQNYTSSSKALNVDIAQLGKDQFLFEIIGLYTNKDLLAYAEIQEQEFRNVLYDKLESGERKYYNRNIHGIKFNTTGMSFTFERSHRDKLSKKQEGAGNSFYGKHHTELHKSNQSDAISKLQQNGGFGLGKTQPDDANKSRSEKLKGKIPTNKGKPAHNRGKVSPSKGRKRGKSVMCDGNRFDSVTGAAKFFNLSENSVRHRLKARQFSSWFYLI